MRAIIVSVGYSDLLAITLPWNRHHFDDVCIVTDSKCYEDVCRIAKETCSTQSLIVLSTELFYANGATFNKWAGLEWALDYIYYRHGWLCLMDADVLWPKSVLLPFRGIGGREIPGACIGNLYTPRRRMWEGWPNLEGITQVDYDFVLTGKKPNQRKHGVPQEKDWKKFPLHRNEGEFAGYSQIFHASDPVLGPAPWHQVDWKHAGGADSFFQEKWPVERKVRPPFECLHLGPAGQNWYGRATPLADGSVPEGASERLDAIKRIWTVRRANRAEGRDQFDGERL